MKIIRINVAIVSLIHAHNSQLARALTVQGGSARYKNAGRPKTATDYRLAVQEEKLSTWGAHNQSPPPAFPHDFESLSDAAFDAISCTLYNSRLRLNPNRASNAMSKSMLHYRPEKHPTRDVGRIGLEIDSARYLIKPQMHHAVGHLWNENELEAYALRRLALILAAKLSRKPWNFNQEKEQERQPNGSSEDEGKNNSHRPEEASSEGANDNSHRHEENREVAIFFNDLRLTLLASQALQSLKRKEDDSNRRRGMASTKRSAYDNVRICCLGQDGIPVQMVNSIKTDHGGSNSTNRTAKRRLTSIRRKNLQEGHVDPTRGVVLVVQPTERGKEPSVAFESSLEALQRLAVSSSVWGLPMIVLSPRLSYMEGSGVSAVFGGIDSSGYEHSATYGGNEPARPTPWLLRDFTPPVYAWVGSAAQPGGHAVRGKCNAPPCYSRVVLSHSVMDVGHPWHLFAAVQHAPLPTTTGQDEHERSRRQKDGGSLDRPRSSSSAYQYLASTLSSSGRPSRDIIDAILAKCESMQQSR